MHLNEALADISHIREQIARTEVFRGYRSLSVAASAALALAAALLQAVLLPRPLDHPQTYVALWTTAAAMSLLIAGSEMWIRARRARSAASRQLTRMAAEQFLPCVVAGAVLTQVIVNRASDSLWLLPGLWAMLFGLGILASYRLLPRQVFWVGVYYLVCGAAWLRVDEPARALSPWSMGLTFGAGQLVAAAILYWTLERGDGQVS